MARVRMVTRTVEVTVAEVMALDVTTAEVTVKPYEVTGAFNSEEEVMKTLKKTYETDSLKLVKITTISTKETLYGMPEQDFIKQAQVLPPRGVSELDASN